MSLLPAQPSRLSGLNARQGDPLSVLRECPPRVGEMLAVEFQLAAYWLDEATSITLVALYHQTGSGMRLAVTDQRLTLAEVSVEAQFAAWARQGNCAIVEVGAVLPLVPVSIPKPWGREIWYSGIEQRGICGVGSSALSGPAEPSISATDFTPIPWLQAAMPGAALGGPGDLVLLKILDPAPEPVIGDLYFELHQRKREMYVVTHVDAQAWPDGVGYIRYGFDPDKIAAAGSPEAFREQYLDAVRAYERTRRTLDALNAPPDESLLERERSEREHMDSFCALKPLRVGDVVRVPLRLPHSLLHGVRTIEFQTPVYERMILSFAQRVLTQQHWDTEAALATALLRPPVEEPVEVVVEKAGVLVQRLVDFDQFSVQRISLEAGSSLSLPASPAVRVGMVVTGQVSVGGQVVGAEEAILVPCGEVQNTVLEASKTDAVFLLAIPVH